MSNRTYWVLLVVLSLVLFGFGIRAMHERHSNVRDANTDIRQVYNR